MSKKLEGLRIHSIKDEKQSRKCQEVLHKLGFHWASRAKFIKNCGELFTWTPYDGTLTMLGIGQKPSDSLRNSYLPVSADAFLVLYSYLTNAVEEPNEREFIWYLRDKKKRPLGCVIGSKKGIGWSYCMKGDLFTKVEARYEALKRQTTSRDFYNVPHKLRPLVKKMAEYLEVPEPIFLIVGPVVSSTDLQSLGIYGTST